MVVPPKRLKNPHTNISSAKMKFLRNEKINLWILHINDNLCCTCNINGVRILRILSFFVYFSEFLNIFLDSTTKFCSGGSCKRIPENRKGSPFHYLLFKRNIQNRTRLKGLNFFSKTREVRKQALPFVLARYTPTTSEAYSEHERHLFGVLNFFVSFS